LPGNYAARSPPPPPSSGRRRAELVLCVDPSSGWSILGCAGIEISDVRKMDGYDGKIRGVPVMSNLAVGRGYRRLGLAGGLVRAAEDLASREWGCGACYLYVEGRNRPALRLYEKLGYVKVWEDGDATTLLPSGGGLTSGRTTIVCMKKELGGGMFGNLFRR
jgi:ribosomal protein S18 acetylase RimI-like enzyme